MTRVHIEQAIRNLEAEKQQLLRQVEQRVMQEKIVPFNREIDEARDRAIQQLSVERDAGIKALQDKFVADREDILLKSEQHKKEHADEVVAKEATGLVLEYDFTIAELKKLLGDTEE